MNMSLEDALHLSMSARLDEPPHPIDPHLIRHAVNTLPNVLRALKDLAGQINLSKLNIRKDFSLINAHAAAGKAILEASTVQIEN